MTTKTDIKKLLSKGLTGQEAGRLILQDNWEVDHDREGFLSDKDIQTLKASLKTTQDIQDYNRLVDIYRLVDYTLKDAHIQCLEAQNILLVALGQINKYLLEDKLRAVQLWALPSIVTQKQYEELKAKQRANRLKEISSLKQILEKRAGEITPKDLQVTWLKGDEEGSFYEYLIYYLEESAPELWQQTVQEILDIIKAGRLRLVQASDKDIELLEKLWTEIRETREDPAPLNKMTMDLSNMEELHSLYLQDDEILQKLYQAGRGQPAQADLASAMEQLLDGSLSEDEEYKLLEFNFCSGEDLYQAGLPEWIRSIDTYIPGLDDETAARPVGMMQGMKVAIIQDPDPDELDERGYWIDKDPLSKISDYRASIDRDETRTYPTVPEFLRTAHKQASERIKAFLAVQAVTEAISKVAGVNFTEDLEKWYTSLESYIDLYNLTLTPKSDILGLPHYLGLPELESLKIGRLKPTAKSLKYYQDRMAIALGKDWYKEAIKTLDFEVEEQDSLAQELAEEIKTFKSQEEAE